MALFSWLCASWAALACSVWCVLCIHNTLRVARLRLLADESPHRPSWPRVSIVIAACNEADTIEPALLSLCAVDYPALEIIVVDDRSTDGTGATLDRIAREDARIVPVHVDTLPAGWLGKVNALDAGARRARGDWLLFTDADVHFAPTALRKAIARCEVDALDHLTVLPDVRAHSLLEEVVLVAFGELFMRSLRVADVATTGSSSYAGIGAFNLVRRSAFACTEGFSWLRMEVVDDVGLGLLMRRSGARVGFALGTGEIALEWYSSLSAMAKGLEKNMFALYARFRYERLAAQLLGTWLVLAGPVIAIAQNAFRFEWVLGACALACSALYGATAARRSRRAALPFLLMPIGHAIVPLILLRSAVACWRQGGIVWRGTSYALPQLRAGQRVLL